MRQLLLALVALAGLLRASTAAAPQPPRLALLIGNQGYQPAVGALKNPHNDIELMRGALEAIGFKSPTLLKEARRSQILVAVRQYAARLAAAGPGAIGFLYYSGHGAAEQDSNVNYLIPVDAGDPSSASFWDESVRLEEITRMILDRAPNAAHFVVFDACRNELKLPDKSTNKGFVAVPTLRGMFVAFASEFGRTASDAGDTSGPYAAALAAELVKPGLSHLDLFQNVKEAVALQTADRQRPWELNGLTQRVRLGPTAGAPSAVAAKEPPRPEPSERHIAEAERHWQKVRSSEIIWELEAYIRRYGDTFHGDLAKGRLEELKKKQLAQAAPPPASDKSAVPAVSPAPTPPAPARCDRTEMMIEAAGQQRCFTPASGKTVWFKDCESCPEMVLAPAGRFTMGSPRDELRRTDGEAQISVTIPRAFAVGRFAVTRGEFAAFVAATGHKIGGGCYSFDGRDWKVRENASWESPGFEQKPRHPVVCVSWHDAKAYVAWLSQTTGKTYRLLSEAEREYVTRAGSTTRFWWGKAITAEQANYNGEHPEMADSAKGEWRRETVPVGRFEANPWGLYNVHGNVWDWTEDCWNASNASNPGDGSARTTGDCRARVARGGSWANPAWNLRAANRTRAPTERYSGRGFRVARTL